MGIFSWLGAGGAKVVGETITTLSGATRNIRNTFAKNLPPDEQAKFDMALAQMEADIAKAQAEVNAAAARSARFFVAGARPFILWVCGIALAYHFLIAPLLSQIVGLTMPPIDMAPLMTLLFGMLGLAGMRTYEKFKGVQDRH